jgi:4-phytase/acid phosphatase
LNLRKSSFASVLFFYSLCGAWSVAQPTAPAPVRSAADNNGELRFVAIVTRHGVRSPTGKLDLLNQYSAQPWPRWKVPDGYLTAHGFHLMEWMGVYDRAQLAAQGLLAASGCGDAAHIRIVADSDQRTRETGRALAQGLAPGCTIPVVALPEGTPDPLFHPVEAGLVSPDRELAAAALAGRIGGNPSALAVAYRPQLEMLRQVLAICPQGAVCNSGKPHSLVEMATSVTPGKSDHLAELRSPLGLASTMTENFLLEYIEGMESAQVGWGRVDAGTLRALLQLHVAQEDLVGRTEPIARALATPLLDGLLCSIDQAANGTAVKGALSRPDDRLLILSGHDTNLVNIAGALHLNWIVDGRRDDTPPGGALVFELWKRPGAADLEVRTYYVAQTLEQMRRAAPLTLAAPPERLPVFLPACGRADGACSLAGFRKAVAAAIQPDALQ